MLTLIKLAAGAVLAISILSPSHTPKADTCECKAKGNSVQRAIPHADTCECKTKSS